LLLRTTAALDPRNPGRDLTLAADLASRLRDTNAGWTSAAGESLRLVANELTDARQRVATLEASRDVASSVSGMVQRGLALRLDSVTIERDTLLRKASTLEQQLVDRDKQLKEKDQELERIRKLIRNERMVPRGPLGTGSAGAPAGKGANRGPRETHALRGVRPTKEQQRCFEELRERREPPHPCRHAGCDGSRMPTQYRRQSPVVRSRKRVSTLMPTS
jgi:hypothetical protein